MKNFNFYTIYRNCSTFQFFLIIVAISNLPFSASEIKHIRLVDDSRPYIIFDHFGFSRDGHVDIWVKNVSYKSKHPISALDPSLMGFFLVNDSSFPHVLNQFRHINTFCLLSSNYVITVFQFDKLRTDSTYNSSMVINETGEYSLVFQNCQSDYKVSMTVHSELYTVYGGRKFFLSLGQMEVSRVYFLFFFVYFVFLAIWVYSCMKNKRSVEKIHLVMCALLLFKALNLLCAVSEKLLIIMTGGPHGWDKAFYFFGFFKGVMLFIVIVLIGTGWSVIKPFLQVREKKVLMVVIPLQVVKNIAYVVIEEMDGATMDKKGWYLFLICIDMVCCCAVIFPIIWSIRHLKESTKFDDKLARNLEMLTRFKQFYIVVIGYLYFTKIVVPIVWAIFGYRYEWVRTVFREGASLCFYCFVFRKFKPVEKKPHLTTHDKEELVLVIRR